MPKGISVPLVELESIEETLTSAFYFSQLSDLADSYRALKEPIWSPMTEQIRDSILRVRDYIDQEEPEEDEEVDDVRATN